MIPRLRLALHWEGRGIDHLHAHGADAAATIAMHASRLLGVGFSFSGHSRDLFPHRVGLEAKLRWARFIVCISEFHRRYYQDRGADPNRLTVVYGGIDLKRFRPRQDGPEAMPRIVAVGRLVETHGFGDLVRARHLLSQRGGEFQCVIAGGGPEEEGLAS